jgi:putative transposase
LKGIGFFRKLKSLDLSTKKEMVDKGEGVQATTLANPSSKSQPSLNRQLELLGISKTAYYYKPIEPFSKSKDKKLLDAIDKIHTKYPYYGTRRNSRTS